MQGMADVAVPRHCLYAILRSLQTEGFKSKQTETKFRTYSAELKVGELQSTSSLFVNKECRGGSDKTIENNILKSTINFNHFFNQ